MATAREVYRARPTQAEIDDVLGQRLTAALGTLNDDGSVHLAFVLFLYEAGRFVVETSSVTTKAHNIEARASASIMVQGRASTGRSLMVAAEGSARLARLPEAQQLNHRLREKYLVPDAVEAVDEAWLAFDDVALVLVPQQWRSWTGVALAAATAAAIGRDYEEIWKLD